MILGKMLDFPKWGFKGALAKAPHLEDIRQRQTSDCGLACIAMISKFYGMPISLESLLLEYPPAPDGHSLKEMQNIGSKIGFHCTTRTIDDLAASGLKLPAVILLNGGHYVVLENLDRDATKVNDPARGVRYFDKVNLANNFSGYAVEFVHQGSSIIRNSPAEAKLSIWKILKNVRNIKQILINVVAIGLVYQCLLALVPLSIQHVIDEVIGHNNAASLSKFIYGLIFISMFQFIVSFGRQLYISKASGDIKKHVNVSTFSHLINLPVDYFSNRTLGEINTRFSSLYHLQTAVSTYIPTIILDGLIAVTTLALIFYYDVTLACVTVIAALINTFLRYLSYSPLDKVNKLIFEETSKFNSTFMEAVNKYKLIKLFGMEEAKTKHWATSFKKNVFLTQTRDNIVGGTNSAKDLITNFETVLIIYIASQMVLENSFTIGMLFAFIAYKQRFTVSYNSIIDGVLEIKLLRVTIENLSDILLTKRQFDDDVVTNTTCTTPSLEKNSLVLDNISFRYPGRDRPAFENLSLVITDDKTVFVSGVSGSGKTTLMNCLLGLLTVGTGEIRYNGRGISANRAYRAVVAGVMQQETLLAGTLRENIASFHDEIDDARLMKCCEMACIHEDIMRMKNGYETKVNDLNIRLSGGQVQRLAIARALYKQPKILVLDEATNQLDTANEQKILANLATLDCIRIFSSHRQRMTCDYSIEL